MSNHFANWSAADVDTFNRRHAKLPVAASVEGVPLEIPLHNRIIKFCNEQWPRWKFIHANPTAKSTIAKGCQDFTIFAPGRVLCVECKARNEKPDADQLAWHKEMEMLGYTVHVVRNYEQFLEIL